jgi:ubiquinone/menaquinone biosynthesis C-methylase UbiE
VLDLGCGSGYLSFPIAVQNPDCRVVGLDIVSKTIENNMYRAEKQGINNLTFISYDGMDFPFQNHTFDAVATRYALHHFPDIQKASSEISRVLKPNGQFFLSDPTPNNGDENRFVDAYMQLKDDGHIQFYTAAEFETLAFAVGLKLRKSFLTQIRFPRKVNPNYNRLLARTDEDIRNGYDVKIRNDEIWITENVLNMSFQKE